ncbi:MAG TPA: esterase [bacterium]|jgi:pimeloyl-ACP methyl ester carboxylesterase|nr:esterase [bacterium]
MEFSFVEGCLPASAKKKWKETILPFKAGDGMALNLVHVQNPRRRPKKGPVLLVHGAGVSADIFRAPVETDVVDFLLEKGYDVWLENWRASIVFPFNPWTLDQAAVHDHPYAVRTLLKKTGAKRVKAIIHCQGSTSFMMSAVAGLLPEVDVILSNAVSLNPVVPPFSGLKIRYLLPLMEKLTDRLNPQWGLRAPGFVPKMVDAVVQLTHHECQNPVCKEVSFTYGSGFPALWSHANLNDATHEWLKKEFAAVPLTFFAQMDLCVRAGHLVSLGGFPPLPADFTAQAPKTRARFSLFAGKQNLCFLPQSQTRTFEFLKKRGAHRPSLHLLNGYGHLDVFMGKDAAKDVFPLFLSELEKKN